MLKKLTCAGALMATLTGGVVPAVSAAEAPFFPQGDNFSQAENIVFQTALKDCVKNEAKMVEGTLQWPDYARCLRESVAQRVTLDDLRRMKTVHLRRYVALSEYSCRKSQGADEMRTVQCALSGLLADEQQRRLKAFGVIAENEGLQ